MTIHSFAWEQSRSRPPEGQEATEREGKVVLEMVRALKPGGLLRCLTSCKTIHPPQESFLEPCQGI